MAENDVLYVSFGSNRVCKSGELDGYLSEIGRAFNIWENFIISERLKKQEYKRIHASNYFWRTHTKQEVDWVEERDGALFGYEFIWSPKKVPILNRSKMVFYHH
jgi:hypothetical protein